MSESWSAIWEFFRGRCPGGSSNRSLTPVLLGHLRGAVGSVFSRIFLSLLRLAQKIMLLGEKKYEPIGGQTGSILCQLHGDHWFPGVPGCLSPHFPREGKDPLLCCKDPLCVLYVLSPTHALWLIKVLFLLPCSYCSFKENELN